MIGKPGVAREYRPRRAHHFFVVMALIGGAGGVRAVVDLIAGEPLLTVLATFVGVVLLCSLFTALAIALFTIGSVRCLRADERGVRMERRWAPERRLVWADIERVEPSSGVGFRESGECWKFHLRGGGVERIWVGGLPEAERGELFRMVAGRTTGGGAGEAGPSLGTGGRP